VQDPLAPEVPIEFAGAGAWEALVLASVLAEDAASVVVLDEPAVALHPSQQRQLGAHLLTTSAQFLVSAQLGLKYLAIADGDASKPDAQADALAVRDAVARQHETESCRTRGADLGI
jgi:hypothetical protein